MDMSFFEHEYDRDRFVQVQPDGKLFKMWTNEHCWPAYQDASFEEFSTRLVASMSAQLVCFIDVGAHHGYYSLLVGSLAPKCEIFAFEPVLENFLTMKQNLDENHLGAAKTYNCAISDHEQIKDFYISTASDNCSFIVHPNTPTKRIVSVQTYPLDYFYEEMSKGPILIKIDTDGHELEVLDGMQEIINTAQDLRLLIEFNPKLLKIAGHAPEEMFVRLDSLGFDLYLLSDTDGLFFHLPKGVHWQDYVEEKAYANILCLRKRAGTNLLFFSHSSGLNGAERSLLEQVAYFIDHGNMCTVVVPGFGPMVGLLRKLGAAVLMGGYDWWCSFQPMNRDEQLHRLDASFRWLLENQALLKKINPDVFFTITTVIPWGALSAAIIEKPHIWSVTEFGEASGLQYFIPFTDVLKFIEHFSCFILTNSKAVQKTLFGDLGPDRIETIYRTISIPNPKLDGNINNPFVRPDAVRLILVGTITPIKGQLDAIMATRELVNHYKKDVELLIVGPTVSIDYRAELEELIDQSNLQEYVHLLDFQENIFPILQQAEIVLMCSRMEALGRITVEAMLCGKPVIGVNRGGTPELIADGLTGFLYEPGDYRDLAEKIAYLCDQPEKRNEFGQNGMKYAQAKFTSDTTHEQVLQITSRVAHFEPATSNLNMQLIFWLFKNSLDIQQSQAKAKELSQQEYISQLFASQKAKEQDIVTQQEYISQLFASQKAKEQDIVTQQEYIAELVASQKSDGQKLLNQQEYIAQLIENQTVKDKISQSLSTILSAKEHELDEIYKSKAWRYVLLYRRWKERLGEKILRRSR